MKTIKGPAIFLAQFAGDKAPFDNLESIAHWAAGLGYKGVQIPSWDGRLFDLKRAAESKAYCEEVSGTLSRHGLHLTELSTHLQGQLVAVHPAYDIAFDGFAPDSVKGNPRARQAWAVQQLLYAAKASANLGLRAHATFSGALAWPYIYPWPQRPAGLIETAFDELGARWKPILNAFDAAGVDLCFEIHPGEDLHDGATLPPAHQDVSRQRRGISSHRAPGRLRRVSALDQSRRTFSLARRRTSGLHRHFFQTNAIRFRWLGRPRMGMLHQERRTRRCRGRSFHRPAHHSSFQLFFR